ncbi:hypothetical protein PoB_007523900 [Plakobranchus ocellatus]|uniref:Endonuclease/exonuclease/phosphatase domain-containing protein n=1 Tax=Plakobranchus ocellatus TaxID=259542 RepID=A0AAV4DXE2_9GAST|nr:hypothetical protein PoB_007523900 [Plakobranchus ocellatus]
MKTFPGCIRSITHDSHEVGDQSYLRSWCLPAQSHQAAGKCLVVGDFNSHSPSWEYPDLEARDIREQTIRKVYPALHADDLTLTSSEDETLKDERTRKTITTIDSKHPSCKWVKSVQVVQQQTAKNEWAGVFIEWPNGAREGKHAHFSQECTTQTAKRNVALEQTALVFKNTPPLSPFKLVLPPILNLSYKASSVTKLFSPTLTTLLADLAQSLNSNALSKTMKLLRDRPK